MATLRSYGNKKVSTISAKQVHLSDLFASTSEVSVCFQENSYGLRSLPEHRLSQFSAPSSKKLGRLREIHAHVANDMQRNNLAGPWKFT